MFGWFVGGGELLGRWGERRRRLATTLHCVTPSNTCRANWAASPSARYVGYIQLCVCVSELGWDSTCRLALSLCPLFTAWRSGTLVSERCPAPQWEGLIVRRESELFEPELESNKCFEFLQWTILYSSRFYFTKSIKSIVVCFGKFVHQWEWVWALKKYQAHYFVFNLKIGKQYREFVLLGRCFVTKDDNIPYRIMIF